MGEAPHSITLEEAWRRANEMLTTIAEESGEQVRWWDGAFGLDTLRDTPGAWVFYWNTVAYLASGDFMDQALAGPIVVPKDGSEPWIMNTAEDEDTQLGKN